MIRLTTIAKIHLKKDAFLLLNNEQLQPFASSFFPATSVIIILFILLRQIMKQLNYSSHKCPSVIPRIQQLAITLRMFCCCFQLFVYSHLCPLSLTMVTVGFQKRKKKQTTR